MRISMFSFGTHPCIFFFFCTCVFFSFCAAEKCGFFGSVHQCRSQWLFSGGGLLRSGAFFCIGVG